MAYSTDRSKAVIPVLVLLFVALWFILWGDLFYVLPCVILFLCFSVLLALQLPRLGKRELIFVLFIRLFDLRLFGFVCFLILLVSRKGCGLWLWHPLDFSLTFIFYSTVRSNAVVLVLILLFVALFGFVCFLILFVSGMDCRLLLWHSLGFSPTFYIIIDSVLAWYFGYKPSQNLVITMLYDVLYISNYI